VFRANWFTEKHARCVLAGGYAKRQSVMAKTNAQRIRDHELRAAAGRRVVRFELDEVLFDDLLMRLHLSTEAVHHLTFPEEMLHMYVRLKAESGLGFDHDQREQTLRAVAKPQPNNQAADRPIAGRVTEFPASAKAAKASRR
jgi:hypothetical protein